MTGTESAKKDLNLKIKVNLKNKGLVGGIVPGHDACEVHTQESLMVQYGVELAMLEASQDVAWVLQQEELYVVKGTALTTGVFKGIDEHKIRWTNDNLKDFFNGLLYKPMGLFHPQQVKSGRSINVGTIINIGYAKNFEEVHITYLVINKQVALAIEKGELQNSIEATGRLTPPDSTGAHGIERVNPVRVALVPNQACENCTNYETKTIRMASNDQDHLNFTFSVTPNVQIHDTEIIKKTVKTDKSISRGIESMSGSDKETKEMTADDFVAFLTEKKLVVTPQTEEQSVQLASNPYPVHGQDPANAKTAGMGDFIGKVVAEEIKAKFSQFEDALTPIKQQLAKTEENSQTSEIEILKQSLKKDDPKINFEVELAGLTSYCDIKNTLTGMLKYKSRLLNLAKGSQDSESGNENKPKVTPGATDASVQLSAGASGSESQSGTNDDKGKNPLKDLEKKKVDKIEGMFK